MSRSCGDSGDRPFVMRGGGNRRFPARFRRDRRQYRRHGPSSHGDTMQPPYGMPRSSAIRCRTGILPSTAQAFHHHNGRTPCSSAWTITIRPSRNITAFLDFSSRRIDGRGRCALWTLGSCLRRSWYFSYEVSFATTIPTLLDLRRISGITGLRTQDFSRPRWRFRRWIFY